MTGFDLEGISRVCINAFLRLLFLEIMDDDYLETETGECEVFDKTEDYLGYLQLDS